MQPNFDKVVDRFNEHSFKQDYFKQLHQNKDLICLTTADYDVECPPEIRDETKRLADFNCFGYTLFTQEQKQHVCDYYQRHHGFQSRPEHIQLCYTGMSGIGYTVAVALKYGFHRKITLILPEYSTILSVLDAHDLQYNSVEMVYDPILKQYQLDYDELDEKLKESSLLFFSNPHNPNGHAFSAAELQKLLDLCRKHDVTLCSDEVWSEMVFNNSKKFTSMLSVATDSDKVIAIFSPGKSFNIAGLGTGIMICRNEKLMAQFQREMKKMGNGKGTENIFIINLIDVALTKCDYWLEAFREHVKKMMDHVINYCKEHMPRINIIKPDGTSLLLLDFTNMMFDSEQAKQFCLNAGVCLVPGSSFYFRNVPIMRMNVASYTGLIDEALQRLYKQYQQHQ